MLQFLSGGRARPLGVVVIFWRKEIAMILKNIST